MTRDFIHKGVKFGINGIAVTGGSYLLIRIGLLLGIKYIPISIMSSVIMITISYFLSAKFVFQTKKSLKSLVHFLISQGLGFILFNLVNYILYQNGLDESYCFLIAIAFSATTNFLYNNFVTFKK